MNAPVEKPRKPKKVSVESLRKQIDKVDDEIHDRLMKRWQAGEQIGQFRRSAERPEDGPRMRPAREAEILRRVVARHSGSMPVGMVVRIWREILAANVRAQASYRVHVYTGAQAMGFWDLARAYFGSVVPMTGHASAQAVLHACAADVHSMGVVPMPESAEDAPGWWSQLSPAGHEGPRIIARLPFATGDEADAGHPEAYAISAIEQEETGDDSTVLLIDTAAELSLARLQSLLKQAGLEGQAVAVGRSPSRATDRQVLLEIAGFVGREDPRLAALATAGGDALIRAVPVGGFANPLKVGSAAA